MKLSNRNLIIIGSLVLALGGIYAFKVYRDRNSAETQFDKEILEKGGLQTCNDGEICEGRVSLPKIEELERINTEDLALLIEEITKTAEDNEEEMTPWKRFLRLYKHKRFIRRYRNNLLLYYLDVARRIKDMEDTYNKEEKVTSKITPDELLNGMTNAKSIKEMKRYYTTQLQKKDPQFDLEAIKNELEGMTGRDSIRDFIASKIIAFGNNYLSFINGFQHMILMAPAGYGKTHVARLISRCLSHAGIIQDERLLITTKNSFVSPYVNHTATMTRNTLIRSIGGLLFIDEAYSLARPKNGFEADHGHEAITEIVNFIDKYRGLNIIIAAGYENEMKKNFIGANEGMARRFPTHIMLEAFSPAELAHICIQMIDKNHGFASVKDDELRNMLMNLIYTLIEMKLAHNSDAFPNQAGDMDNLAASISANMSLYKDKRLAVLKVFKNN